ncbi:MAG TPA: aldose epimerase family protein [Chitinophagaceae bacterium]|nr:aldose epimerase family protein [Chitinophagaceae bacterium]
MNSNQQYCFKHSSGEDIYLFALRNTKGNEVLITNYGAIITSMKLRKADGSVNDIVLGFDRVEDYCSEDYLQQYIWMGCAVGRYANRIKDASCIIDGKKIQLSKNRGNDLLHGGETGFDKKIWQVASFDTAKNELELKYKSPDGEEGFPGNLDVSLRFKLDNDEFAYEYKATTDRSTIVNLTHHGYFNLENGKGKNYDYLVRIDASHTLDQNENLVATGTLSKVEDTEFDFRQQRKIGNQVTMENGYDKSFVLAKKENELTLAAEAFSERSNTKLEVYTTEPILHFYSGKGIPIMKGKNGNEYSSCSGFCFETHKHPNAINVPHFPNTILRPGEIYYEKTIYRFFEP